MLFITVRSASPADVPKVLQVVEHVKRLRHKRGDSLLLSDYLYVPLIRITRRQCEGSIRRPPPICRVRLAAHGAATHQARRFSTERVHAAVEPLRAPE